MHLKKITLLILLCSEFFTANYVAAGDNASHFYGNWNGAGRQDKREVWTLQLIFDEKQRNIIFHSLHCRGHFDVIDVNEEKMLIQYSITQGNKRCVRQTRIELLKKSNSVLDFTWFNTSGQQRGYGTLAK